MHISCIGIYIIDDTLTYNGHEMAQEIINIIIQFWALELLNVLFMSL